MSTEQIDALLLDDHVASLLRKEVDDLTGSFSIAREIHPELDLLVRVLVMYSTLKTGGPSPGSHMQNIAPRQIVEAGGSGTFSWHIDAMDP
jgi:hypothetical protein